ncbi:uncharacterized protein isoform X2 [Rhodnius prolixus]|uniref:uncharacterized protein isoform X2 n=1 Tax=Rhodnius prolixus TaxID=13249 RepID=UPI003D189CF0
MNCRLSISDSDKFNKIKLLLISRDISKQLEGVRDTVSLIKFNWDENGPLICDLLIQADFIEILCESLSTVNTIVILGVFDCLELLMNSNYFFKPHHHGICVYEALLRILHISLKREDTFITSKGFTILSSISSRLLEKKLKLSTFCDIAQLISVIHKAILENENDLPSLNTATDMLLILMESSGDITDYKHLFETVVPETILLLCCNEHMLNRIIKLAEIITLSLKFIHQCDNSTNQCLITGIKNVLENIIVPFLMDSNIRNLNEGTFIIMRSILSFYYIQTNKTKLTFTIYLMNVGFLTLLETLDSSYKEKHQFLLVRSLIFEILVCLSENLLGKENWKSLLIHGLLKLTCKEAFISLKGKDQCEVTVIIIFNYFKLLECKRFDFEETYLRDLSDFILNWEEIPSEPILKAVWFEFSVAFLNGQGKMNYIQKTFKKILLFLHRCNIRKVYTHHPAILYWTFSNSFVNKEFRKNIMILWLENNDKASQNEILCCLMASKEACTLFLEIVATSATGTIAENVLSLLLLLLSKDETVFVEKFSEEAWVILPHILTKLCSSATNNTLENISTLLTICSESISKNIEMTVLLRISYLLPTIIANYYKKVINNGMSKIACDTLNRSFLFAIVIMEQAEIKNDKRVILTFLNHDKFLTTLESCYSLTNDKNLCTSVMVLLGHMLQYQLEYIVQSVKTVQLPTEKFIEMIFGDPKIMSAGLRLLALFLKGFISKMPLFIRISSPTTIELRSLYIHIHMICAQANDEVCVWCWECLQYLLTLSKQMKLQSHLATLPYTQKLFLTCTPGSKAWVKMLSFLPVWISSQPSTNRRALNFSSAQKSLSKLSNKLLTQLNNLNDPKIRSILLQLKVDLVL